MISFAGLCAELDCKLTNYRNRWSGYNREKKRGVFTLWVDRLNKEKNRYVFGESAADDSRAGARELRRHIIATMSTTGEAYGILCEAADVTAKPRVRKSFDSETLLVLRFAEEDGVFVAYVVGEVDVGSVKSGVGRGNTRSLTDAIDDLNDEPPGAVAPDRTAGIVSMFRRDSRIRAAVLKRAKGKCEYCGESGFELPNGRFYVEAHHIINLAKQGKDTLENVIALCANHHREAHYGKNAAKLEADMAEKLNLLRKKAKHT